MVGGGGMNRSDWLKDSRSLSAVRHNTGVDDPLLAHKKLNSTLSAFAAVSMAAVIAVTSLAAPNVSAHETLSGLSGLKQAPQQAFASGAVFNARKGHGRAGPVGPDISFTETGGVKVDGMERGETRLMNLLVDNPAIRVVSQFDPHVTDIIKAAPPLVTALADPAVASVQADRDWKRDRGSKITGSDAFEGFRYIPEAQPTATVMADVVSDQGWCLINAVHGADKLYTSTGQSVSLAGDVGQTFLHVHEAAHCTPVFEANLEQGNPSLERSRRLEAISDATAMLLIAGITGNNNAYDYVIKPLRVEGGMDRPHFTAVHLDAMVAQVDMENLPQLSFKEAQQFATLLYDSLEKDAGFKADYAVAENIANLHSATIRHSASPLEIVARRMNSASAEEVMKQYGAESSSHLMEIMAAHSKEHLKGVFDHLNYVHGETDRDSLLSLLRVAAFHDHLYNNGQNLSVLDGFGVQYAAALAELEDAGSAATLEQLNTPAIMLHNFAAIVGIDIDPSVRKGHEKDSQMIRNTSIVPGAVDTFADLIGPVDSPATMDPETMRLSKLDRTILTRMATLAPGASPLDSASMSYYQDKMGESVSMGRVQKTLERMAALDGPVDKLGTGSFKISAKVDAGWVREQKDLAFAAAPAPANQPKGPEALVASGFSR